VKDPFEWLVQHWIHLPARTKSKEKVELALALAPYLMPRLKAVDVTHTNNVEVVITIGGIADGSHNQSQIEHQLSPTPIGDASGPKAVRGEGGASPVRKDVDGGG
jgi:hypothetical protein